MTDENTEQNVLDYFNEQVAAGKSKDDIIMGLVAKHGLDIVSAVRKYQTLARNTGLVLGAVERTKQVNEYLEGYDLSDAAVRRECLQDIADKFEVSTATAGAHIRSFAEANGIELPSQNRNTLEDMVKFVQEQLDADKSRAEVVESLQDEMGYTANSAASAYSRATRELGINSGRVGNTVPLTELVAFVRANQRLSRKALVTAMHEELGYAESTANSFLTYVNFAKEWTAQEIASREHDMNVSKQG